MADNDTNQSKATPTARLSGNVAGGAFGGARVSGDVPPGSEAAVSADGATQPLTQPLGANSSDASASGSLSEEDAVKSRRLAHGLSPESPSGAAELRRKEKQASAEERKRKFRRERRAKMVKRSIIAVVLVLVVGTVFGFWMLRWGLYDDASSIQGAWRVQGTDTTITITDKEIVLTDEVAYDYVLDPGAKTLSFTFGGLSGNGRYRFSLDHSQLAIDDGEFDWFSTLVADIPWTVEAVSSKLVGDPEKSPRFGAGDMALERVG